ncbi:hypothetical protein JW319_18905 [Enterobacter cloacae subsp. cloacae]|uniref:hypothetical protein n=2 Tax=Enterobacter cloacae TaxID=550 RepID=UPI000E548885|nr:hypothetical protein [Enterobacter cloacae]MBW4203439.1 hypothetical protein [Enterobacter cloacae subsp. cloacae]MCK7341404.1 hypothetical protein [Enterobacter cloacae]MDA2942827.1 hypothetical protein [Enterobacter cloacae]RHI01034.1 hypothetical protein DW184_15445 [Enterobacter cloacae]
MQDKNLIIFEKPFYLAVSGGQWCYLSPTKMIILGAIMWLSSSKYGLLITIFSSVVATCLMAWAVYSSSDLFFWCSAFVQMSGGYVISWSKKRDDREDSIVSCAIITGAIMLTAVVANYVFFDIKPSPGACLAWIMLLAGFFILMKTKVEDFN